VGDVIDTGTERGAHVAQRLHDDLIVWLTTVSPRGAPITIPIWFLWDGGDSLLVYSQPNTAKLRNIEANSRVCAHLNDEGAGQDIVIMIGTAELSDDPPADQIDVYIQKYLSLIDGYGWTPESFAADYSVPFRLKVERLRGDS
jgi:PPOX class probable F420-dependent enzyme